MYFQINFDYIILNDSFQVRWERTDGKVVRRKDEPMLPEDGESGVDGFEKLFLIGKFKFNINIIYS